MVLNMRIGRALMIVITFIFVGFFQAQAATLIDVDLDDAPSSEGHAGVYTGSLGTLTLDTRYGTPANMFDHVTGSECWGGTGGCAKFWPSTTSGGAYRGFVPGSYSGGTTQLNIRYLGKWNSAWQGGTSLKGNMVYAGDWNEGAFWTQEKNLGGVFGAGLQMTYSYDRTSYYIHGSGQSAATCTSEGLACCPHQANCNLGPGVDAAGPFFFANYNDQWVYFEIEILSTGTYRLYITTQDGMYNGLYMETRNNDTGTPGIQGISGVWYTDGNSASGSYVMVDEVIVADTYIGPPAGFVTGTDTTPPAAPTGLTIM